MSKAIVSSIDRTPAARMEDAKLDRYLDFARNFNWRALLIMAAQDTNGGRNEGFYPVTSNSSLF
jgi:hypothetical protein